MSLYAWFSLEQACAAVWQEGKARSADDFARRVRVLFAAWNEDVAAALVEAETRPLYTSRAPAIEWQGERLVITAGGAAVDPAVWDNEPDTYWLPQVERALVEMIRRTYGGTAEDAWLTIRLWDRRNGRDELFCRVLVALHLGDGPEYDHATVLAYWRRARAAAVPFVATPKGQLTLFGEPVA